MDKIAVFLFTINPSTSKEETYLTDNIDFFAEQMPSIYNSLLQMEEGYLIPLTDSLNVIKFLLTQEEYKKYYLEN